jgi:beta-N-acetylhexosaminidase
LLVVECVPERMMAADPLLRGLAAVVAERDERSTAVRVEGERNAAELLAGAEGRRPVLVLRDPLRHRWQQLLAAQLVALRPDTVVVDIGYPAWRPAGAAGYVTTYGAGRVNLEAAAGTLLDS